MADNGPVAGDHNTTLDVVAFNSSTDYQTYAGAMFGIDTNNGGMSLEGDPAVPGNQPRFIAYEAEWLRPAFEIWYRWLSACATRDCTGGGGTTPECTGADPRSLGRNCQRGNLNADPQPMIVARSA